MDRRLPAALAVSVLIHAALIGAPGWRLPFGEDEPEAFGPLQARLAAPRQPAAAPAPRAPAPGPRKPRPAPVAPAAPEPVAAPAAPALAAVEAAVAEAPAPPEAAVPAPVPAQAEIAWPRQGRIRFVVTRGEGEQGMALGQSVHEWSHDGLDYTLRTVTETTGLVALFRPLRIVQVSEGAIDAEGLAPREFRVERNGQAAEGARFDREAGRVTLMSGGAPRREAAQGARGAQDLLSQAYQLGLVGVAARLELMIATGKNFGPYVFEAVGEERLKTPLGDLRTWHVRTPAMPGEQATELWLAEDYRRLPVRIRHIDRKGDVFDQTAVEMEIEGTRLAERLN